MKLSELTLILLFPETLSEKLCLGNLAMVIPSNVLSHPPQTHTF